MEDKEIEHEGVSPETATPASGHAAPEEALAEPSITQADGAGVVDDAAPAEAVPATDEAGDPAPAIVQAETTEAAPAEAGEYLEGAAVSMDDLMAADEPVEAPPADESDADLKAVLEAVVYIADEPLTVAQMASALNRTPERIQTALNQLIAEFEKPEHGIAIREVAGGFKMATKAEHHDAVRNFVKSLKPPLKLSLPALETLAVIAYKQPVTGPEIMEIRGVQGGGVLKTLLDRKLIAVAGRKNVIGKPMLYKTTKEFLIQFGLKDLSELPSLKEFEEIRRMAFSDAEPPSESAVEAVEMLEATAEVDEMDEAAEAVETAAEPEQGAPEVAAAEPAPEAAPEPAAESTVTEASEKQTES